jgi:hypothetical protein
VKVTEGEPIKLDAIVGGVPDPKVYWTKDDNFIVPGMGVTTENREHVHMLTIDNSIAEDAGTYNIVALNPTGEDSSTAKVEVQGRIIKVLLINVIGTLFLI